MIWFCRTIYLANNLQTENQIAIKIIVIDPFWLRLQAKRDTNYIIMTHLLKFMKIMKWDLQFRSIFQEKVNKH